MHKPEPITQLDAPTLDQLMEVWESAVRETHTFLQEADITALRPLVREAFGEVSLHCLRDGEGGVRAFSGVAGDKLEMLFVHSGCRGGGMGKRLAIHAISNLGVRRLDVNEQNPQAQGFYSHLGFRVTGRSPLDGQGNPFPLLHMKFAMDPARVAFVKAVPEDGADLAEVQTQSFRADYLRYGACPGYSRTAEELAADLARPECRGYKILLEGALIGDILVQDRGNNRYRLGCLCFIPRYQNMGIGAMAMEFLREEFPEAVHWSLETPADKEENLRFYRSHGYAVTGRLVDQGVTVALMEKTDRLEELEGLDEATKQQLAHSLTGTSTDILPFLPYLLQDFWELGSDPEGMADLLSRHVPLTGETRLLDLACGKGAVSVRLAKALGLRATGVDIIPEFIGEARKKAEEYGVAHLCAFQVGDVKERLHREENWDIVVNGAAGPLLGGYPETLEAVSRMLKPGGFFLWDDAYIPDDANPEGIQFHGDYPTWSRWQQLFGETGFRLVDYRDEAGEGYDSGLEMRNIEQRAGELMERHPQHRALLEDYVESQRMEYHDLAHDIKGVTWLLRKENAKGEQNGR